MEFARLRSRLRPGTGTLLVALAVELVDELFDGTKSAAMPLIRHDLSLSYAQVGLLAAVPLIAGGILELPVGIVSGTGARRRRFILIGGLAFCGSVLAAGLAGSFAALLIALTIFFPASGAFVEPHAVGADGLGSGPAGSAHGALDAGGLGRRDHRAAAARGSAPAAGTGGRRSSRSRAASFLVWLAVAASRAPR